MKNIPLFTSEYGLATLILAEIPANGAGFVLVHMSEQPEKVMEEGAKFCRMCGAEAIYGTVADGTVSFPVGYRILEFTAKKDQLLLPDGRVKLVETDEEFEKLYDQIFGKSLESGRWNPELGRSFFAYAGETLVGIGQVAEDKLVVIGSLEKGMGYPIATALLAETTAETITLDVSDRNKRAIGLYKKLGFQEKSVRETYFAIP